MGKDLSQFKGVNMPVDNVSWFDGCEYCYLLSIRAEYNTAFYIKKSIVKNCNRQIDMSK